MAQSLEDLSSLVEQIRRTAGFNFHHWGGGMQHLYNDYHDLREETYFRASKGMRVPPTSIDWETCSHPVGNFFSWDGWSVPDGYRNSLIYVGLLHFPIPLETKTRTELLLGFSEQDY